LLLADTATSASADPESANELAGLWQAKRRFGPDVRGMLLVAQNGNEWQAEIAGRKVPVKVTGNALSFQLDGKEGEFRGTFDGTRALIVGHWIQQVRVEGGMPFASPVTLAKSGRNEWRGEVIPAEDTMTFYLMVHERDDGSVGAFLRNPERNLGRIRYRVNTIERDQDTLRLLADADDSGKRSVVTEGRYRKDPETLTFFFDFGGSYDFTRIGPGEPSDFFARGRPGVAYRYAVPPQFDDGWPTASVEEVGLSRERIEAFVQRIIDTPVDSTRAQEDHSVLIARHGKLVLEEYFHGESRERPHDNRSAGKSVASDLFGAALHAGLPVSTSARVYGVMNGGELPADLEPRRTALTVQHLLTMSSGFDCDDNDPDSPGYEDRMWEQTSHPDFYSWTMNLGMVRDPGEAMVYCSANPNLVGGVIARATGRYLPALFHELIARPLEMKRYYLPISPTGDFTMTGGSRFLPRDFIKLAQLHLNGGTWKGHRVYTAEWSRQATTPHYDALPYKLRYGYLWWLIDYPYRGRTIRGYFASGNGGQISMAIPELQLAMAFHGGNYNDIGYRKYTDEYIPEILAAAETS
jgi:CubicO group peptidase (beta-lactamase class C family)